MTPARQPTAGADASAQFRTALTASLRARPCSGQPDAAALRRWSDSLQKAAALAPDAGTRGQLDAVAHYVTELAHTPEQQRPALQQEHPDVTVAATELRTTLAERFGVDLLG